MAIVSAYGQEEVIMLHELLKDCKIILVDQVIALLQKKSKTPSQIDAIINKLVGQKLCFYDETKKYLRINQITYPSNMTESKLKALWFYVNISETISYSSFMVKTPTVMTFTSDANDIMKVYHVFHIQKGQEALCIQAIVSGLCCSLVHDMEAFLIIDEIAQIRRIELPESIHIKAYALIDTKTGEIEYYKGEKRNEQ